MVVRMLLVKPVAPWRSCLAFETIIISNSNLAMCS